jgi:hypothetical protein
MFLRCFFGSFQDPYFDLKISSVFIKMITCSKKKKKKKKILLLLKKKKKKKKKS